MRLTPLLLLLLAPDLALAWPPNGVRLTGAPDDQVAPWLVSDGEGGTFVGWQDFRAYGSGGSTGLGIECYIQRVTSAGQLAPGWPIDGLVVGTGPWHQFPAAMLPDGSGGVLIVYGDTGSTTGIDIIYGNF